MALAIRPWVADLLYFWFHTMDAKQWFARSDTVDAALRRRFGRLLVALGRRPAHEFLSDPLTARAAVLLFDQCPRNLRRGRADAFAFDPLARAIAKGAIARGWDKGLLVHERQFLYMPLMHSENANDQIESLRLYTRLGNAFVLGFARDHAAMVRRFGRFPHRNAVLARASTAPELNAVANGHAW